MIWTPTTPVRSSFTDRMPFSAYAGDVAVDEDGDLVLENGDFKLTTPDEGFAFQVRNRVLGTQTDVFTAQTQADFEAAASSIADSLLNESIYDRIVGKNVGVGHTIESVDGITRDDATGVLTVTMTCTGADSPVSVTVKKR